MECEALWLAKVASWRCVRRRGEERRERGFLNRERNGFSRSVCLLRPPLERMEIKRNNFAVAAAMAMHQSSPLTAHLAKEFTQLDNCSSDGTFILCDLMLGSSKRRALVV